MKKKFLRAPSQEFNYVLVLIAHLILQQKSRDHNLPKNRGMVHSQADSNISSSRLAKLTGI